MRLVSIIYYISLSQQKETRELWQLYTSRGSRIYLFTLELMIEIEFNLEVKI